MENSRQKFQPHLPSRNASFSSSLLDAIDQSIARSGGRLQPPPLRCATRLPAMEKRPSSRLPAHRLHEDRRFLSITPEKPSPQLNKMRGRDRFSVVNSSSSSSESSYGGLSSSETKTKNFKTPVSPGARLAGFINSLFSPSAQSKKAKITSKPEKAVRKSSPKRSVRFIDEDPLYLPRLAAIRVRQENPQQRSSGLAAVIEEERKRYEKARKLISSYEERKRGFAIAVVEEEEEDDSASYCSSDLFELKDLSAIGGRRDELPVYETTSFSRGIVV